VDRQQELLDQLANIQKSKSDLADHYEKELAIAREALKNLKSQVESANDEAKEQGQTLAKKSAQVEALVEQLNLMQNQTTSLMRELDNSMASAASSIHVSHIALEADENNEAIIEDLRN